MRQRQMKQRQMRPRQSGFSMLEVFLATLLLGVAIVALTEGISVALRSSKSAERHTVAVLLAESQLELIRTDSFLSAGSDEAECELFPGYRYEQEIEERDDYDGLYSVRVSVFHGDSDVPLFGLETLLFDGPSTPVRVRGTRMTASIREECRDEPTHDEQT